MTDFDFYIRGQQLSLLKKIGRGGEGEVFLLAGNSSRAIKIYHDGKRVEREKKVQVMVQLGLAKTSRLVAFPEEIVTTKANQFAGFAMRLVEGFQPLHDLYGPKSRKIYFPNADFRFLVRAATNVARAVGQVHSSACVVGDLNPSGILISSEATAALIDADSFQIQTNGELYPCLVGVPEFTPPELQGRSLQGLERTKTHDYFGLAVAIFQLLFMGRHPYSGSREHGDLTLDQLIARNLFDYSRKRGNGIRTPNAGATFGEFPSEITDAFEYAFGLEPSKRPSALEWVGLLQGLENRLSQCSVDRMHLYPTAAKSCLWCRVEAETGASLFIPKIIVGVVGSFDVEAAWLAISAVILPDIENVFPRVLKRSAEPSSEARAAKAKQQKAKRWSFAAALCAAALWIAAPNWALLWVCVLIFGVFHHSFGVVDSEVWLKRHLEVERKWDERLLAWRASLGLEKLRKLQRNLEQEVLAFRGLGLGKSQAIQRLRNERKERQLSEYLERFLISRASIPGIGPARTSILLSFGIESAADITQSAIILIPGFGSAIATRLCIWRQMHERRFVYNPAQQPSDVQAQAKIENEFATRAAGLAKQISIGRDHLIQAVNNLGSQLVAEDSELTAIAAQRTQLDADFTFLGFPGQQQAVRVGTSSILAASPVSPTVVHPSRPTSVSPVSPKVVHPSSPTPVLPSRPKPAPAVAKKCPKCGAKMVRRKAKRGYTWGAKKFWGCSRYPNCFGSRP